MRLGELNDFLQPVPKTQRAPFLFLLKETLAGLCFEGCPSTIDQLLHNPPPPPHNDRQDWREFLPNDDPPLQPLVGIGVACLAWHKKQGRWDTTDVGTIRLVADLLRREKIAAQPYLCIGDYFFRHRDAYHHALEESIRTGRPEYWLEFFLSGIRESAESGMITVASISRLYKEIQNRIISGLGQRVNTAFRTLDFLMQHPVTDSRQIADGASVDISTANRMIKNFLTLGILVPCPGNNRNRRFIFEEYVALFR